MNALTRTPRRLRALLPSAVSIALLLVAGIGTTALAGYWNPQVTVRQLPQEMDPRPEDLSAGGVNVVAGWRQEAVASNNGQMWVRDSTDSGGTFGPWLRLAADPARPQNELSLDSGGGSHWAAWSEMMPTAMWPQRSRIFLGAKPYAAGFWDVIPVSTNADIGRRPTVVHTTGRVFVVYQARISGAFRVLIQNTLTDEGVFGGTSNLGSAPWSNGAPHADATNSRLHVVWSDGNVRLKRASLGGGPGYSVNWQATQNLGPGESPIVVTGGMRVVIFYYRNGDTWVRVSENSGGSFAAAEKLMDGDPKVYVYQPESAAISGTRVVVSVLGGGDAFGTGHRLQSFDGGETWSTTTSNPNFSDWRKLAFTSEAGSAKLAELWFDDLFEDNNKIVYRRQD